jgi:hypothetical protein
LSEDDPACNRAGADATRPAKDAPEEKRAPIDPTDARQRRGYNVDLTKSLQQPEVQRDLI